MWEEYVKKYFLNDMHNLKQSYLPYVLHAPRANRHRIYTPPPQKDATLALRGQKQQRFIQLYILVMPTLYKRIIMSQAVA